MITGRVGVVLVVGVLAAGGVGVRGQLLPRAAPADVGLDAARLDEATRLLEAFVAEQKIAGAVAAVARHGKVAYLQSVGVQDLQTRAPMTQRTLFRIYSMTKAVTAAAVMLLHDEGRFGLDDPVSKHLPEFDRVCVGSGADARPPARPVTVRDLLLHTSGLSHRTSDLYGSLGVRSRADTLPVFVTRITGAPLMEDPGTRFRYSEATTVLGRLVEMWSKQDFETFLIERVLTPLGMNDTRFWVAPEATDRLATVYGPVEGSPRSSSATETTAAKAGGLRPVEIEQVPFTERPALIEGAVGLVSTVPDFLRFCQMLLNKGALDGVRVLKPETVAEMTSNGLEPSVLEVRGGSMGWGLANVNVAMPRAGGERPPVGEYGWDGTAGTIFWIDPSRELVTILMTQSSPANPDGLRQKFKAIVESAVEATLQGRLPPAPDDPIVRSIAECAT
jgi:CubicO group peptidase (beta-lactamase class C family)